MSIMSPLNTTKFMSRVTSRAFCSVIKVPVREYTPRRALMYVPGNDKRKIEKASKLDVDCVAMDCEDGVAMNMKDAARNTIRSILSQGKPQKSRDYDWAVRVNSVDSGLCGQDLEAVLTGENLPDSILLPKVDRHEHVKWFSEQAKSLIKSDKKIGFIAFIESAVGMLNLPEICNTAMKLSKTSKFVPCALVFGSDDFCANIGVTRTDNCMEVLYARQKVVLVAKAFNLQAIDMVYIQYKDLEGLKQQSEEGARMGYTGKQVIHPSQVPIVQEAFMPSKKQVEWATGLLTAFEEHQKGGKGAFTYEGSMIDMPTMKQAQNVINLVNLTKDQAVQA